MLTWALLGWAPHAFADSETWLFNGTTSGWTSSSGTTASSDGSNLHAVFATGGGIYSPSFNFIPASGVNHNYTRFAYRITSGNIVQFKFNFQTAGRLNWSSTDYFMSLVNDGAWHWVTFPLDQIGDWRSSTVTRIRLIALAAGGGGASGVLDLDFLVLRLDHLDPDPPAIDPVSPPGFTTGPISVAVRGDDPPPDGFDGSTNPDQYASGVSDFGWRIDGGSETWQPFNNGHDIFTGIANLSLIFQPGSLSNGCHTFTVRARDRCGRVGPTSSTTLYVGSGPHIVGQTTSFETGAPVGGIRVSYGELCGPVSGYVISDANGYYQTPPLPSGSYSVGAGICADVAYACQFGNPIVVTDCDGDRTANFRIRGSSYSIVGRCTSFDTGEGLGGIRVTYGAECGPVSGYVVTDANGYYQTPLLPLGSYSVGAGLCADVAHACQFGNPVVISCGGGDRTANFRIRASSYSIVGRCIWADTGQGAEGIRITYGAECGPVSGYVVTDASGYYQTPLLPLGEYSVGAGPCANVAYACQFGNPIVIECGGGNRTANFTVTGSSYRIVGRCTSFDTGIGVSGTRVSYGDLCGPVAGYVFTDADGYYQTPLLPVGSYSVGAGPCADVAYACQFGNPIVIACGGGDQTTNFRLRGSSYRIVGFSTSFETGAPVVGDRITYGELCGPVTGFVFTNEDGYYETPLLPPGDYSVGAGACADVAYACQFGNPVVISCGDGDQSADFQQLGLVEVSGLTVTPGGDGQSLVVNWTTGTPGTAGYILYRAAPDGDFSSLGAVTPPYVDGNLACGETYFYTVVAFNACERYGPPSVIVGGMNSNCVFQTPPEQVVLLDHPAGDAGEGANTALGAVTRRLPILALRGPGGDLVLMASYSSVSTRTSVLGPKWVWTLGQSLLLSGADAVAVLAEGGAEHFTQHQGVFVPDPGISDSLLTVGDGYELMHPSHTRLSFDSTGLLRSIADRNGNVVTLTYQGGMPTQFTDRAGRVYGLSTANGRLTQIQDPLGRTWLFEYDAAGYLARYTDAKGSLNQFSYDGAGRLTRVVDPRGHDALRCTYDADGRVATQIDAVGGVTTFTHDTALRRTSIMNALGGVRVHVHDANYRLLTDTDERGYTASYAYDFQNNRIEARDRRGNLTRYEYDSRGNVTKVTDPLGAITTTTYDPFNNPLVQTDALGGTTTNSYDVRGNLLTSTNALGNTTSHTYDSKGQLLTRSDANGHVTTHTYDAAGNLVTSTNAAGDPMIYVYDLVGRLTASTNGRSYTTAFAYDQNDSLVVRTDALGHPTSHEFDASGNRTATVDARGKRTSYAYDAKSRLTATTNPLGQTTQDAYDALDRRVTLTDPRGNSTVYVYDATGNQVQEIDPLGHVNSFTYDADGNRLSRTDPRGKTTTFTYDARSRLLSTSDPLGHVATKAYDPLGRTTSTTNPRGNRTLYEYDAVGRLTAVQAPTGAWLTYAYDAVGNRIRMRNAHLHMTTYAFDQADRLAAATDPLGRVRSFAYDAAGNRIQRTDALGRTTTYSFDAVNRLLKTQYPDGSEVTFTHDANGNLTGLADQSGVSSTTYDDANQLTTRTDAFGQTVSYAYDPAGNLESLTYPGGWIVQYTYDSGDRLASVRDWLQRTVAFGYDEAGNSTSTLYPNGVAESRAYDDAGQLLGVLAQSASTDTIVAFSYQLDENGNRVQTTRVDRRDDPERRGGGNVYATSASLSAAAFPAGADSVILAAGEDWAEAIGAAALARRRGLPALVVPGENLWSSSASRDELVRLHSLHPNLQGLILGEIDGISEMVEVQLEELGIGPLRIAGANRHQTAALVAPSATSAVLLGSSDARRAGAVALLAGRRGWPLLLCEPDSVPVASQSALQQLGVTQTLLVGDLSTIGPLPEAWLNSNGFPVARRFSQADPGDLSAALADYELALGTTPDTLALLNQNAYQDAVSAGALLDPTHTVALLVHPDDLSQSPAVTRWIGQQQGVVQRLVLLAGPAGLTPNLAAGIRSALRTTITEYTYNALDELASEIVVGVDSTIYTYDQVGNRTSETHNGSTTAYAYDGGGRLVSAGSATYTYDANGNRLTQSHPPATYAYDFDNRLVQIIGPEGTSQFGYDGLGRRVQSSEPGRNVRYVLDVMATPYRTLVETDIVGQVVRGYVHAAGLISHVDPGGVTRYYHFDGLGSTAAITDELGQDTAHAGFEAFGSPSITLGDFDSRHGYVGRYGVESTLSGLYFMRARFFDPTTGVFLSIDPVEAEETAFLRTAVYLYADGNPVGRIDPDGNFAWLAVSLSASSGWRTIMKAHDEALTTYVDLLAAGVNSREAEKLSNQIFGSYILAHAGPELAKDLVVDEILGGITKLATLKMPRGPVGRGLSGALRSVKKGAIGASRAIPFKKLYDRVWAPVKEAKDWWKYWRDKRRR